MHRIACVSLELVGYIFSNTAVLYEVISVKYVDVSEGGISAEHVPPADSYHFQEESDADHGGCRFAMQLNNDHALDKGLARIFVRDEARTKIHYLFHRYDTIVRQLRTATCMHACSATLEARILHGYQCRILLKTVAIIMHVAVCVMFRICQQHQSQIQDSCPISLHQIPSSEQSSSKSSQPASRDYRPAP